MIAIKVSEETLPKILWTGTSIAKFDLPMFVKDCEDKPTYYIPFMDDSTAEVAYRWATYPEEAFLETFDADMTKIDTHFVDITRK